MIPCRRVGLLVHSIRLLERAPRAEESAALKAEHSLDVNSQHMVLSTRRPVFSRRSRALALARGRPAPQYK